MSHPQDQARAQFQDELDLSLDGETVELGAPRERPGPVVIRNPILLDGHGCTIWAQAGPVVTVVGSNVVLKNLRIEYTADGTDEGPNKGLALRVDGAGLSLDNVTVRGTVIGLPAEEGEWRYPHQLNLGALAAGQAHAVLVRLVVPVPCQLTSEIAGVQLEPRTLAPGAHEVRIRVEQMMRDTLVSGTIGIKTAFLRREIVLNAHMLTPTEGLPDPARDQDRLVWQPTDWDALVAAGPRVPPPASIPVTRPAPLPPPPLQPVASPPPVPVPQPVASPPPPAYVPPPPPPYVPPPAPLPPLANKPPAPKPTTRIKSSLPSSLFTSPPVTSQPPVPEPPPVHSPPVRSPVLGAAFSPPPPAAEAPPIPPDVISPPSTPRKSTPIRSKNPLFNPPPPPPPAEAPPPAPAAETAAPTEQPAAPTEAPPPPSSAAPKKKFRMAGMPAWAQDPKPAEPPPPPAEPPTG